MKRHEQLIIQDRRNTQRIERALRDAVNRLTNDQLKVFIEYMKTYRKRMGYETCTTMKMRGQLRRVSNVSLSSSNIHFVFRGSYGDALRMTLPARFLDNAQGRQAGVDWLKREMKDHAEQRKHRHIRELKVLAKRYPKIVKEILERI